MNRILKSALPVALSLVATAVLAGGPECHKDAAKASNTAKHCTMSAEECKKGMAEAKNRGWLGIEGDAAEDGSWLISKVVPGSPAEAAGFHAGDVLYAMNGVTINEGNEAKLMAMRKELKPGSAVTYTVKRGAAETRLSATLGTMPEKVYQQMVAEHMKEHEAIASNK